uniref:Uncharacterized protein n=1 Tax=Brassica oleracea var. oleracea TaxID=109376 RepID=A0A0D3D2U1_BRAOL
MNLQRDKKFMSFSHQSASHIQPRKEAYVTDFQQEKRGRFSGESSGRSNDNCRAHTETNMEELRQRRKRCCERSLNLGCLSSGDDVAKRIRQGDLRETTVA